MPKSDISDYTEDKINLKDFAGYGISVIVFLLLVWVIPTDKLIFYFHSSETTASIIKIIISLALSVAMYFGLQYLFYPKSQFEVEQDLANLSYSQQLQRILDIADLAKFSIKFTTRASAAKSLEAESKMLRDIYKRFMVSKKPVELNRFVLLLQEFAVGITKYCKVRDPNSFIDPADRKRETDDTELNLIPQAEAVIFKIGKDFDSDLLTSKEIADGSFESLAKSFGYLDKLNKE